VLCVAIAILYYWALCVVDGVVHGVVLVVVVVVVCCVFVVCVFSVAFLGI